METYSFDGQRRGERVLAVVKNHPVILLWPGLKAVCAFAAAVAIVLYWQNEIAGPAAFIFAIVGFSLFGRSWFIYSHSNLVITNERIVNVEQSGFWAHKIMETELANIQDISSDTKGFLRTILHYGNLVVRTSGAAQGSEIIVKNIGNPYEVQQVITNSK